MKKSDLKPGMVTEYANGGRRLVIEFNDELFLLSNDNWADLKYHNSNLECSIAEDFTINKIYQPKVVLGLDILLNSVLPCIWERPKSVELTMEEIAEKFGINVEQLKIKK
jgi:hypothetical protein